MMQNNSQNLNRQEMLNDDSVNKEEKPTGKLRNQHQSQKGFVEAMSYMKPVNSRSIDIASD